MMAEIFGPVKGPLLPSDILIIVMLFFSQQKCEQNIKAIQENKDIHGPGRLQADATEWC